MYECIKLNRVVSEFNLVFFVEYCNINIWILVNGDI